MLHNKKQRVSIGKETLPYRIYHEKVWDPGQTKYVKWHTTVVIEGVDEMPLAIGVSRCNLNRDNPNRKLGIEIALGRALKMLTKETSSNDTAPDASRLTREVINND